MTALKTFRIILRALIKSDYGEILIVFFEILIIHLLVSFFLS